MGQLDKAIKIVNSADTAHFPLVGAPEKRVVVTFTVGKFGPFTEVFSASENNADSIAFRLNAHAHKYRELGALE